MIRVIATHFDAPGYVGSFKTTVQLSQPKLDDIKRYVEEIVKPELPSKYECIIKIEGLEISPENEQTINLKVTWTEKNDIYPAQMLSYNSINTIDNHGIRANQNMLSSENPQPISAPTETIHQDQTNQHHDGYGDNQTSETDKTESSSIDRLFNFDFGPGLNLRSETDDFEPLDFNGLLEYLEKVRVLNANRSSDRQDFNLDGDLDLFEMSPQALDIPPATNTIQPDETQPTTMTNTNPFEHEPSSSNSEGGRPQPTMKRPHPTDGIECNKKQKQPARSHLTPRKIRFIKLRLSEEAVTNTDDVAYDVSKIPLISQFTSTQMIEFELDIDKNQKVEYPSNRDPVRQQSDAPDDVSQSTTKKTHRNIVPIQGDKKGVSTKTPTLPLLKMPAHYLTQVNRGDEIAMGTAVVKEYRIGETEVGFYAVGNKIFLKEANTDNPERFEQYNIIVTKNDVKDNKFSLKVYMVQVSGRLKEIVGPALFRIKRSAALNTNIKFKFGDDSGLPRLAVYFFKRNVETGEYEPDWETLCLSEYLHQKRISKK